MDSKIKRVVILVLSLCIMISLAACSVLKSGDRFEAKELTGLTYYITDDLTPYDGEYTIQKVYDKEKVLEYTDNSRVYYKNNLIPYEEYNSLCEQWGITPAYNDANKNYIVYLYIESIRTLASVELLDVVEEDYAVDIYVWDKFAYDGDTRVAPMYDIEELKDLEIIDTEPCGYMITIPIDTKNKSIEVRGVMNKDEFERTRINYEYVDKPVIYIYTEEETEVEVKLNRPDKLTCSYPKYNDSWKVLAHPDGTLTYEDKSLYCLYYESEATRPFKVEKTGFIVPCEEVASFLEEKLNILGLNDREAEEFIIYWLPKLEQNKYNYIRFATSEEIEKNMGLKVIPTPDTTIRILMTYRSIDHPVKVQEQVLEPIERHGYTVVEWGGTEIK